VSDESLNVLTDLEVAILVGIAVIIVAVVGVFVFALLRTAQYPPSTTLVLSLSMLTLVALVGFAITRTETLGTISAAGIGALAGSVTAQFAKDDEQRLAMRRKVRQADEPEETP
jgi:chromate transport protein ChrA